MEEKRQIDTLIVGQGLAGTLLGYTLLQQGQKIKIYDPGNENSASKVAAGLINPLTGKRLVIDPEFPKQLKTAKALYAQLEDFFNCQLLHPRQQIRTLDPSQLPILEKKLQDPLYQEFIRVIDKSNIEVKHSYFLDTQLLLHKLKLYFLNGNNLVKEKLEYDQLSIDNNLIRYNELKAKKIIFCEGAQGINNPYFKNNDLTPCKGEILTLELNNNADNYKHKLLNGPKWLLHKENKTFKAGATYSWDDLDNDPTDTGKTEILNALKAFQIDQNSLSVIEHKAGLRPTSKNRKPIVINHEEYRNSFLFNGFGSKGSLTIPTAIELFKKDLENFKLFGRIR